MATDPQSIQNYLTIGGILGIGAFLTLFESRVEKIVSAHLNTPERLKRERDLIRDETRHLAEKDRSEETRNWLKALLATCKHCPRPDLTSTDAIKRDAL